MPSGKRLTTLVQISDLHFSRVDAQGRVSHPAQLIRLWAQAKTPFDGLLGHHERALDGVVDRFDALLKEEEAILFVTGDVTQYGNTEQFEAAEAFFKVGPRPGIPSLQMASWPRRAIAGNHDWWCGTGWLVGPKNQDTKTRFEVFPYVDRSFALPNGMPLAIIGIDSDADILPSSFPGLLAQGAFTKQLGQAAALLGSANDREIRLMLLHHSRLCSSWQLEICEPSRNALDAFVVDHDIAAIMTGHIHVHCVNTFTAEGAGGARSVVETRCGTSTVWDKIPDEWRPIVGWGAVPHRLIVPNVLLVHRLYQQSDGRISLYTDVEQLYEEGFQKFEEYPPHLLWPLPGDQSKRVSSKLGGASSTT